MFKISIKDTCFGTWKVFEILFPFFSLCVGPGPGETFRVPRMYNTEYQFYGSEKPVTVWLKRLVETRDIVVFLPVYLTMWKGNIITFFLKKKSIWI